MALSRRRTGSRIQVINPNEDQRPLIARPILCSSETSKELVENALYAPK